MRLLAPATLLTACLLVAVSASADDGTVAPAAAAPPAMAAPAMAAPVAPVAPGYSPAPPGYAPAPPYVMYPAYGAGAPPPYWMPIAPPTERRSNGMRTTGIVLFGAGGLVTAIGVAIFSATITTPCVFFDAGSREGGLPPSPSPAASSEHVRSARQALNGCDTSPTVGLGIMGAGLLTAVAGIPLFVLGSKQVPARQPTGKLVPEVSLGAANASFRWTF